jgi:uncharacterized protein (DUF2147 family)
MRHPLISFLALAGGLMLAQLATPALAQNRSAIEGVWLTPQQSEMQISSCVEGFCGYISRIVITDEIRAKYGDEVDTITNYTDYNNKNPALRNRPIQGLQILTLRAAAKPGHFEGEIYSPEDGNTYAGFLEVVDANTLKLKGCAMMILCQEQAWRRVR